MTKNVKKSPARSDTTAPSKRKQKSEAYLKYQSYIRSKYWKTEVRPRVLERDGYRCVCCGRTAEEADLTVHHSNYGILYHELEGDNLKYLVTLDKFCHNAIHRCPSNRQRFKMDAPQNNNETEKENEG